MSANDQIPEFLKREEKTPPGLPDGVLSPAGDEIATLGLRVGGAILDLIIFNVGSALLYLAFSLGLFFTNWSLHWNEGEILGTIVCLTIGFYFFYYIFAEAVWGATLAKHMLGMRVVRAEDGLPIGFGRSIVRNFLRIVDYFPAGLIGIVALARSDRKQRVGDMLAQTLVVLT